MHKLRARLSFRDPGQPEKYLGDPELWDKAQATLLAIVQKNELDYFIGEGEAAFYGPKIDFMAQDAIGREHQLATPQLDFVQPQRFGLKYINEHGVEETPVMIHFALMGSIERFLSVYIEHTAGNFPLWLSPLQVKILPIGEKHITYAETVLQQLQNGIPGLRVEIDSRAESIGKKIREAEGQKTPYMLIVGDSELTEKQVSVRGRGQQDLGASLVPALIEKLSHEITTKAR